MIARHSHEQSDSGEGVEVIVNSPCEHQEYGKGQYTEKRIHLSRFVATWPIEVAPCIDGFHVQQFLGQNWFAALCVWVKVKSSAY